MKRLFHLVPRAAWENFLASGRSELPSASLDEEGFVHLSFGPQLEGTLAAHFAGHGELVLVEVEGPGENDGLVLEPARGGHVFPHLYRPLRRTECARTWILATQDGAAWDLPHLGADPGFDEPPGNEGGTVRPPEGPNGPAT